MITDHIYLREQDSDVRLDIYLSGSSARPAVLICPGGAYAFCCDEREGEPIALRYLSLGFNAFVLQYSVGEKAIFPRPLVDAALAMAYIRRHAEALRVLPEQIFVCGFSAGGHLAASLGILWDLPILSEAAGVPNEMLRPAGMVLGYPVISAVDHPHEGSFANLLGEKDPPVKRREEVSMERLVKPGVAVPAFLFHTAEDGCVPVHNSLALARAYADAGIPFEMHIFPRGGHGLGLANEVTACGYAELIQPEVETWLDLSVRFLKTL